MNFKTLYDLATEKIRYQTIFEIDIQLCQEDKKKMTQSEYSSLAKDYIISNHPLFAETLQFRDDDSFHCSIKSENRHLSIWIATYDSEITVGFEDAHGNCDWHTHMSLYGAYEPDEEFASLSKLLQTILSGAEPIIFSSKNGYTLTNDVEEDLKNKDSDEVMIVYRWSELWIFDVVAYIYV